MGSSKKVTVGYRYYLGLHFGLCHGPVDTVQKIVVGERDAWSGEQTTSGSVSINAPNLFGGDKREGGVVGTLDVLMGEPTQVENSYLVSKIGAAIPAFRGILSAVWRGGQVTSNNPYLKPWAFKVRRILQGWSGGSAWYPEKATVGEATYLTERGEDFVDGGLGAYTLAAGNIDAFQVVSTPYGSGMQTRNGSGYMPHQIIRPVTVPGSLVSLSVKFNVLAHGVGEDSGVILFLDTSNNIVFSFNSGREPTYEALQRPNVAFWAEVGSPGNPIGSASVATNEWYQLDVSYLPTSGAFFARVTRLSDGSVHGEITRTVSNRQPIAKLAFVSDEAGSAISTVPGTTNFADLRYLFGDGFVDMNPAHIVYECLTNKDWGMGYPTTAIDSASFTAAADALFFEGFGLSMLWNRQEAIDQFIAVVIDHIGGILYVDPASAKFALKLIRADYDRDTLPEYGPAALVSAESYQRQAWGETVNEITVVYTDAATGKDFPVTVQDLANISVQGGVVSQTRNYPGIRNAGLAARVALRDLQAGSTPLASIKLTATRVAWQVFPGDVFRLSWPEYGIDDVVYRALNVNRGTLTEGQIVIDAVEDVFGLPDNTYIVEQPGGWVDPSNEPAAAPYRKVLEAPYWDLARNLSAADLDYVDALSGYFETLAVRPSGDAINYEIKAKVGAADYEAAGNGDFCPSATIVSALSKTTTAITLTNGVDLDVVNSGGYAVIDDEYVLLSGLDVGTNTATISRGVLDTVPAEHSAGARIWFADGNLGFSTTEYADGEVVDVKLLPVTGQGELDISLSPVDSLTFDQRQYRPYPPGKLLVNTTAYPEWIHGDAALGVTWAHRDRLAQTAYLVEQDEASIGPEASTTYTLRIYGEEDDLGRTISGLTGTYYDYAMVTEADDFLIPGDPIVDPYWANRVLLVKFNGTNGSTSFPDSTPNNRTPTVYGNAQISTAQSKFNGASGLFDGTGDYLRYAYHADWDTGSGDYTCECWIRPADVANIRTIIGAYYFSSPNTYGWVFAVNTNGRLYFGHRDSAGNLTNVNSPDGALTQNVWQKVSWSKEGNVYRLFVEGVKVAESTITASIYVHPSSTLCIGRWDNDATTTRDFNGYIDCLRLTKGVAQYTADYDPPTNELDYYLVSAGYRINGRLRFELESVRGGLVSYQKHNHTVLREGYGFNYGYYYGGQ